MFVEPPIVAFDTMDVAPIPPIFVTSPFATPIFVEPVSVALLKLTDRPLTVAPEKSSRDPTNVTAGPDVATDPDQI